MTTYSYPWGIAGGWALDLFLNRPTRAHGDIDVVVCRRDQLALRQHLRSFTVRKVVDARLADWDLAEWLTLPVHELHVEGNDCSFEVLLNECDSETWIFRRDERIRHPLSLALRSSGGVPYLAPEIVLLYKAQAPGIIDQQDFEAVKGHLSSAARTWLLNALAQYQPGHPWLRPLRAEA